MDTISQFALGASLGDLLLGRRLGKKAMLVGGLLGTLPDLDVLVQYSDAVESFTYHRSWSHSLIILSLASPIIAYTFYYFRHVRQEKQSIHLPNRITKSKHHPITYKRCLLFVWLVLITHAILDGFTIYGTQLFWPLDIPPAAIGSIFIIDPMYTTPLLIALWLSYRNSADHQGRYASVALLASSAYLGLTMLVQAHAKEIATESLSQQNISTDNIIVAPFPFSLIWRIVAMENDNYYEGFYSLFDESRSPTYVKFESGRKIIDNNQHLWSTRRLDWFTRGMMAATVDQDQLVINDLRMGIENSYVFRFAVAQKSSNDFTAIESRLLPMSIDTQRMKALFNRIWDEEINVQAPN